MRGKSGQPRPLIGRPIRFEPIGNRAGRFGSNGANRIPVWARSGLLCFFLSLSSLPAPGSAGDPSRPPSGPPCQSRQAPGSPVSLPNQVSGRPSFLTRSASAEIGRFWPFEPWSRRPLRHILFSQGGESSRGDSLFGVLRAPSDGSFCGLFVTPDEQSPT